MKASALSVDISPRSQVALGAAGAGASPWLGVTEPIEANLLALWAEGDDKPIVIISIDLLYPGRILRAAVEAAAEHLEADRIFLAATHTHRAPMTDDTKACLATPDQDYLAWLKLRLSVAVKQVLRPEYAEAATIAASAGKASHSINRRRKKWLFLARKPLINSFTSAPNPRGVTDETLLTISIRRVGGEPIALLWNYACHPVGYPRLNTIAAHFPHVIRQKARTRWDNKKLPVLFFQGFSGNTRPSATAKVHSPARFMRRLISGPMFEDMTESVYARWSTSLADTVLETLAQEQPIGAGSLSSSRAMVRGDDFAEPLDEGVSFHCLHVGPDFSMVAVSGEVVAEYALRVRRIASSKFTFCVGCIDHTFGYIPTSRILEEGGYEGGNYCKNFGIDSINPMIEENTMKGFREVLLSDRSIDAAKT